MHAKHPQDIWYKNPMVWLIMAIPLATVVGCLATITLAITHPDTLIDRTPTEVSATP